MMHNLLSVVIICGIVYLSIELNCYIKLLEAILYNLHQLEARHFFQPGRQVCRHDQELSQYFVS